MRKQLAPKLSMHPNEEWDGKKGKRPLFRTVAAAKGGNAEKV